ncbi:PaaI family thioesterase [Niveispirillum sp. KHB5.9]|uniref:PaaI family thioesterase n=1 Tax=Niveispirillum sp. KHB5.9 TaxID=3400269 RepID=UPI003A844ACC
MTRRTRTYDWDATPLDPALLTTLPGIEIVRRIARGELPAPSMAATLGMSLLEGEVEEGRVVFEGEPADHVLNPLGTVHGGFAATLLDSAMGCAVHTLLPRATGYGTVDLKISFLRPILRDAGVVRVEGKVINAGRTLMLAEGRLVGRDDGRLYAHGTCTCFVQGGK